MSIEVGCNRPRPVPPTPVPPIGCICKQVIRIDQIQKEALLEESCSVTASLGENVRNRNVFNTRPFSLYLRNGERFSIILDPLDTTLSGEANTIPELNLDNLNITVDNLENEPNNIQDRSRPSNRVQNTQTQAQTQNIRPPRVVNHPPSGPTLAYVFRVESIVGCCAVLRPLIVRREGRRTRYIPTCSCITCDLEPFVSIQYFDDTFINLGICFE